MFQMAAHLCESLDQRSQEKLQGRSKAGMSCLMHFHSDSYIRNAQNALKVPLAVNLFPINTEVSARKPSLPQVTSSVLSRDFNGLHHTGPGRMPEDPPRHEKDGISICIYFI